MMKVLTILLVTGALVGAPAAQAPAQSAQTATSDQGQSLPTTGEVIGRVRKAVGYDRIRNLGEAYAIIERNAEGETSELHFGTRRGELRRGREFGFDGTHAWQMDERRNIRIPSPLRQREKSAWPMWVRGYWWLNPDSGFFARVLPSETNEREIAISLSIPEGVVGATLYIDRSTWLPRRVVVPYERGPFTERYSNFREVRGVLFPFTLESTYRDTSRREVVSVTPLSSLASFERPPLPADHRFDPSPPAALETRQGLPFSSGTPGHVYVRASVDDGYSGWWHFDSGSDSMIIDEAVAEALGMEVIGTHRSMGADGTPREGTWRRARSFQLGPIRIENMVFRALDLSQNNAPPGERRMGTIGYDLFARGVVEYGDGGRQVRICNPATYRLPRGAIWQRLEHIDSTPAFRGVAEGHLGLFQLDTGSAGTIDFARPFHERAGMLRTRETRQLQSIGSGGQFSVAVGRLSDFRLAGQQYRDLEVAFRTGGISREGSAGTIGRDVLGRFTMVFDYPNQRLAFLPRQVPVPAGEAAARLDLAFKRT